MRLADEYRQQFRWRDWPRILGELPPLQGKTVLDLGCGVGDLAAELAARGARVIGVDASEELVGEARSRGLPGAEFHIGDLRDLPDLGTPADGLWCSFAAAYFPDLAAALEGWARGLGPGGWIAVTEVDDLFGHEPLDFRTRSLLHAYAEQALEAGRYDFHMGRKLAGHLERCGFEVSREITVEDRELSFSGPADPDVVDAWRRRFDRMKLLHEFCGPVFEDVREEFLDCLTLPGHRSTARVSFCLGTRGGGPNEKRNRGKP
jgi:SAM-dependent methyltransferase